MSVNTILICLILSLVGLMSFFTYFHYSEKEKLELKRIKEGPLLTITENFESIKRVKFKLDEAVEGFMYDEKMIIENLDKFELETPSSFFIYNLKSKLLNIDLMKKSVVDQPNLNPGDVEKITCNPPPRYKPIMVFKIPQKKRTIILLFYQEPNSLILVNIIDPKSGFKDYYYCRFTLDVD